MQYHIAWTAEIDGDVEIEAEDEADAMAKFRQMRIYDDEITGEDAFSYTIAEVDEYWKQGD